QAGSHPYAMMFDIAIPSAVDKNGVRVPAAGKEPRDITVSLPPGLLGNPAVLPQCTHEELAALRCPGGSQVGLIVPVAPALLFEKVALYNMVPPPGVPAEFAG